MSRGRFKGGQDRRSLELRLQEQARELENLKSRKGSRTVIQTRQVGTSGSLPEHERARNPHPQYASYIHNKATAAASWTITHNRGWYPSVTIVDSAGTEVVGDVDYVDKNTVTVTFRAAFSGKAYLN